MSYARFTPFARRLGAALLIVGLPSACAVGVTPDGENGGDTADSAGTAAGGTLGSSGSGSKLPQAGTTVTSGGTTVTSGGTSSSGGNASPFGGTSSSGGATAGSAAGGSASGGSAAGGTTGGSSSAGSGGSGTAGSAGSGGGCGCAKTLQWVDNTTLSWATGDCLNVSGKVYVYEGTRAQTYANGQCNPTKQETWCTDSGNDYKFSLCP